jgi:hypothetical protein
MEFNSFIWILTRLHKISMNSRPRHWSLIPSLASSIATDKQKIRSGIPSFSRYSSGTSACVCPHGSRRNVWQGRNDCAHWLTLVPSQTLSATSRCATSHGNTASEPVAWRFEISHGECSDNLGWCTCITSGRVCNHRAIASAIFCGCSGRRVYWMERDMLLLCSREIVISSLYVHSEERKIPQVHHSIGRDISSHYEQRCLLLIPKVVHIGCQESVLDSQRQFFFVYSCGWCSDVHHLHHGIRWCFSQDGLRCWRN